MATDSAFQRPQPAPPPTTGDGYSTSELWAVFRAEVAEHLHHLRTLLKVGSSQLPELRRIAHTLKGTAATMGFDHVATLTHRLEDTLTEQRLPECGAHMRLLEELLGGQADRVEMPVPTWTLRTQLEQVAQQTAYAEGKQVQWEYFGEPAAEERLRSLAPAHWLGQLVRNAIVHGIETPTQRRERGKAPVGSVRVRIHAENATLLVEVQDDGQGLDLEAIRQAAQARGLTVRDADPETLYALLLQPGFSTRATPDERAGRGWGLDIVNTVVQQQGGTLTFTSHVGEGTTIHIGFPIR